MTNPCERFDAKRLVVEEQLLNYEYDGNVRMHFDKPVEVVLATDYDAIRTELAAAEQRIKELEYGVERLKGTARGYAEGMFVGMQDCANADDALTAALERERKLLAALEKTKGAMTYAYDDHADQYYLNVKADIDVAIEDNKRSRGDE